MTDRYAELVRSGLGQAVANRLGLPRPVELRRTDPAAVDDPLVPGPVLVLASADDESQADAAAVTRALDGWRVDVLPAASMAGSVLPDGFGLPAGSVLPTGSALPTSSVLPDGGRAASGPTARALGAVVLVLTGAAHPDDLADPFLAAGRALRGLAPGGRVLTLSRPVGTESDLDVAAAREAIDGVVRSIAKELRGGSTANGVLLTPGVNVDAPSVTGAVRFLLSARSAFVSGQLLEVGTRRGNAPADWTRPLIGQVAVVTGAARGIGAAISRVLARDGAHVVAVDLPTSGESLAAVANEVRGTAVQLDITASQATERLLAHVSPHHDRVDIVVHNAGILRDKLLVNMTPDRWDAVMTVNLVAQLRMNEGLLAADALGPHPRLVSLASTSGIAGNRGQTNYAGSKAGIIGMTRALGPLLAERGGTANAVAPGFIETDMTARIPAMARELGRRANSLRQGGLPVDVAEAVAFLASPQAGGVNGQVLRVCGQYAFGR